MDPLSMSNPQSDASSMASGMTPTPMAHPVSLNQAKVSLHALPTGVKAGDTVEMKVTRVDMDGNCAYLEGENQESSEDNEGGEKEGSEESTDGAVDAQEPKGAGLNTDTLLGPMGKLKGYLAQKSVDHQSSI